MTLCRDGVKTMLAQIFLHFSMIVGRFSFTLKKVFEKIENYSFSKYYLNSMSGFKKQGLTLFERLLRKKFLEKIMREKTEIKKIFPQYYSE